MGGVPVTATGVAAFPFSAVLGQEEVKLALLLNAIDPRIGGVLLRGEKGSAKSTLARGLAALLPGQAPFVELPVGATEDRVVGTLDLEAALTEGRRRLQPGLLAAAHGGVLYVDEVNLLPDHLVDVLLDVAASGVNRIEREGVSEAHPARFVLIGSMNPEEGELRPQLLDRFGLSVEVAATRDPTTRAEAVGRRLAFDADPDRFVSAWRPAQVELAGRVGAARPAPIGDELVATIARLCSQVGAEGLRADLVICRAAAALAGWEGRDAVGLEDVEQVALLALAHRRRRTPFEEPGIDPGELTRELDRAARGERGERDDDRGESPANARRRGEGSSSTSGGEQDGPPGGTSEVRHDRAREPGEGEVGEGEAGEGEAAMAAAPTPVVRLMAGRVTAGDAASGRRSVAQGRRGRLVGDRSPQGTVGDLAVAATVRAVASRRAFAAPVEPGPPVMPGDLREAVREQRSANLVVLAVDASASMGAQQRMQAVKGAAISLLLDAYQRRDRVSLVTFAGEKAEVVLRPTGSVEVARARLGTLRTGGRTPLAAGIRTALTVADASPVSHRPLLVLVSDGHATFASAGADPLQEAELAAREVRSRRVAAVVVDVEDGATRLGLARIVAEAMGARLLTLPELSAGALAGALREVVAIRTGRPERPWRSES